jgi:hypothetical protein
VNEISTIDFMHSPDRLTSAVSALDHPAVVRESSIGQALKIFLGVTRPTRLQDGTHWLVGEEVTDRVLTVQLTLEINQSDEIITVSFL